MTIKKVAIVGGTHGNELVGIELVRKWFKRILPFKTFNTLFYFGNIHAIDQNKRYLEKDLNRSFVKGTNCQTYEDVRAKELTLMLKDMDFIIDLHTTTSNMGSTIILVNPGNSVLNLVRYIKANSNEVKIINQLLPQEQNHFLISSSENGLMIEVGPIAQGTLRDDIFQESESLLFKVLETIELINLNRDLRLPESFEFYQVDKEIDYPRDQAGQIHAMIHGELQGKDFFLLKSGQPIFKTFWGETLFYEGEDRWPIFINESAYYEKNIAMILTKKISYIG